MRWFIARRYLHASTGVLPPASAWERRNGKKIAKFATERKLLEWIYHMLKEKRTFSEMERIADRWGEPVMLSGHKGR